MSEQQKYSRKETGVPIEKIFPDKDNLETAVDSIHKGHLSEDKRPVEVYEHPEGYVLADGHHRLLQKILSGEDSIDVNVREAEKPPSLEGSVRLNPDEEFYGLKDSLKSGWLLNRLRMSRSKRPRCYARLTLSGPTPVQHHSGETMFEHTYADESGKPLGVIHVTPQNDGQNLRIQWAGATNVAGGEVGNIHGMAIRHLLPQLAQHYPQAWSISGLRLGGAREGTDRPVKIPGRTAPPPKPVTQGELDDIMSRIGRQEPSEEKPKRYGALDHEMVDNLLNSFVASTKHIPVGEDRALGRWGAERLPISILADHYEESGMPAHADMIRNGSNDYFDRTHTANDEQWRVHPKWVVSYHAGIGKDATAWVELRGSTPNQNHWFGRSFKTKPESYEAIRQLISEGALLHPHNNPGTEALYGEGSGHEEPVKPEAKRETPRRYGALDHEMVRNLLKAARANKTDPAPINILADHLEESGMQTAAEILRTEPRYFYSGNNPKFEVGYGRYSHASSVPLGPAHPRLGSGAYYHRVHLALGGKGFYLATGRNFPYGNAAGELINKLIGEGFEPHNSVRVNNWIGVKLPEEQNARPTPPSPDAEPERLQRSPHRLAARAAAVAGRDAAAGQIGAGGAAVAGEADRGVDGFAWDTFGNIQSESGRGDHSGVDLKLVSGGVVSGELVKKYAVGRHERPRRYGALDHQMVANLIEKARDDAHDLAPMQILADHFEESGMPAHAAMLREYMTSGYKGRSATPLSYSHYIDDRNDSPWSAAAWREDGDSDRPIKVHLSALVSPSTYGKFRRLGWTSRLSPAAAKERLRQLASEGAVGHASAEAQKLMDEQPEQRRFERLRGGKASGRSPSDFDPKALAMGVKVEMEHTDDPEIAREVAMDHLYECYNDPDDHYYTRLKKAKLSRRYARKPLRMAGVAPIIRSVYARKALRMAQVAPEFKFSPEERTQTIPTAPNIDNQWRRHHPLQEWMGFQPEEMGSMEGAMYRANRRKNLLTPLGLELAHLRDGQHAMPDHIRDVAAHILKHGLKDQQAFGILADQLEEAGHSADSIVHRAPWRGMARTLWAEDRLRHVGRVYRMDPGQLGLGGMNDSDVYHSMVDALSGNGFKKTIDGRDQWNVLTRQHSSHPMPPYNFEGYDWVEPDDEGTYLGEEMRHVANHIQDFHDPEVRNGQIRQIAEHYGQPPEKYARHYARTPATHGYESLHQWLGKRSERRIDKNKRIFRNGDDIHVRLHDTDVVIAHPDGSFTLSSGRSRWLPKGWATPTTKRTIRDFTGIDSWIKNRELHVGGKPLVDGTRFFDGHDLSKGDPEIQALMQRSYQERAGGGSHGPSTRKLEKMAPHLIDALLPEAPEAPDYRPDTMIPEDYHVNMSRRYAAPQTQQTFAGSQSTVASKNQDVKSMVAQDIFQTLQLLPAYSVDAIHQFPNGSRPAITLRADNKGDADKATYAAAWLGLMARMPGQVVFHAGNGSDLLHRFTSDLPMRQMHKLLDRVGVKDRTVIPRRGSNEYVIFDREAQIGAGLRALVSKLGAQLNTIKGNGNFIGSTGDATEAREAYRRIIRGYEAKVQQAEESQQSAGGSKQESKEGQPQAEQSQMLKPGELPEKLARNWLEKIVMASRVESWQTMLQRAKPNGTVVRYEKPDSLPVPPVQVLPPAQPQPNSVSSANFAAQSIPQPNSVEGILHGIKHWLTDGVVASVDEQKSKMLSVIESQKIAMAQQAREAELHAKRIEQQTKASIEKVRQEISETKKVVLQQPKVVEKPVVTEKKSEPDVRFQYDRKGRPIRKIEYDAATNETLSVWRFQYDRDNRMIGKTKEK